MKIGIFGGTFNPIHYGHLRPAEEVMEMFKFDRLLFIPAGCPPFKKFGCTDARHRLAMVRAAIKNNPSFEICDIEMKSEKISYSVNTVSQLASEYRNADLFFAIGIDAFLDLPKWKQPLKLLGLASCVIMSRPGCCFADLFSSPYLENVRKKTLMGFDEGSRKNISLNLTTGRKAYLCKVTELDISASSIRSLVKKGKNIKYLLPESVESYIISHKLYRKS
jgi:nicotinate-nucleotide adenylyltransferase